MQICKSFQLMLEGLEAKKKYCIGGMTSKDFKNKWNRNLRDMESKRRDLLSEEHCKKLFYLMSYFWEAFVDVNVDISWLVKVRKHLDKIEKEEAKTKRRTLPSLSRNSHLKRMVLERFDEHLPIFNLSRTFFRVAVLYARNLIIYAHFLQ